MKTLMVIVGFALVGLSGYSFYAVADAFSNEPTATWSSPCGDKTVLGHRVDAGGQTQYVCAE